MQSYESWDESSQAGTYKTSQEASFEVTSIKSAQHLSPELAFRKKTAWAERNGQEAWAYHIIGYQVHTQDEGFPF